MVGPNCMGLVNTDPARPAERDVLSGLPSRRPRGALLPERRARDRAARLRATPEPRHLDLRLRRQQGRRLGQRPRAVLGGGSADRRHPALPRELRLARRLRPDRPARRAAQADRGRQVRPLPRGGARRVLAHGRAGRERRRRGRALPAGRGHPHAARSKSSSTSRRCSPTSPSRAARRVAILTNAGGPGHPRRRRLRGAPRPDASLPWPPRRGSALAALLPRGSGPRQSRSTCSPRPRPSTTGARLDTPARRPECGRRARHLHSADRHRSGAMSPGDREGGAAAPDQAGRRDVSGRGGRPEGARDGSRATPSRSAASSRSPERRPTASLAPQAARPRPALSRPERERAREVIRGRARARRRLAASRARPRRCSPPSEFPSRPLRSRGAPRRPSRPHGRSAIPVVLKAVGPSIVHKTEVGGVRLDLADDEARETPPSASFGSASGRPMTEALDPEAGRRGRRGDRGRDVSIRRSAR